MAEKINLFLILIMSAMLILNTFSSVLRRYSISEPMLALLWGVVIGPYMLHLFGKQDFIGNKQVIEEFARYTLAIGLMGTALRISKNYWKENISYITTILTLGMIIMWLLGSSILLVWLKLPLWIALLVGAIVTPTDPVLSAPIVSGKQAQKNIPTKVIDAISAEAGANDGLAYLLVLLPIFFLTKGYRTETALGKWLLDVVLVDIGATIIYGVIVGYLAAQLLRWAEGKKTITRVSYLGYTIALSLLVLTTAEHLNINGILAVFVAGAVFSKHQTDREQHEEETTQEMIDRFFLLPVLIVIGINLPLREWLALGWFAPLIALLIVLGRRLPMMMILSPVYRRSLSQPELLFIGWFGPIGVSTVYYALFTYHTTHLDIIWPVISLIVTVSVVVHGISATPLGYLLRKRLDEKKAGQPAT